MTDKDKRQKRFQQKRRYMKRQTELWNDFVNRFGGNEINPHRFHKMAALNCGDPKCVMCGNPRKFFGEKTMQERRFECAGVNDEL